MSEQKYKDSINPSQYPIDDKRDSEGYPLSGFPPGSSGTPAGSAPPAPPPMPQTVAVKMPDTKPIVTYVIMGLSILIYLVQMGSQYLSGYDIPAMLGLKVNELIVQGQYWRLITPVLLHGSILHLLVNMYALNSFGPTLEKNWGHWRFLSLYLLGGLGGNSASFAFSTAASLGSSTAIFGLLGAEGVFLYQNKKIFGRHAQQALANIISVALLNLFIGFSMAGMIDNWGHLGGLLSGVLFSWFAGPILHVEGVFPSLKLVDAREPGDIWRAGIAVSVLLVGLIIGIIIYRGG
ncbi:MAG: rhomboid family intramembrane serine protease [Anaerolineales bacterium]|nr:rhomboid family intramembrane serine protease [Anaerolineales bacterium]